MMRSRTWGLLLALVLLAACAPRIQDAGPLSPPAAPRLTAESFRTADGLSLPLAVWAAEEPRGILIALHGMNDYSNAFAMPGPWWADNAGLTTYAIDQRGFGRAPQPGIWPGGDRMIDDLEGLIATVRARHRDVPVFVLGDSMGGAVAIATLAERRPAVDGLILVAPAVWGWSVQPFLNRAALWLGARLFPGKSFTGEGLEIWPSDNIPMLRGVANDPLVIKGTRTDAIHGLVTLMDRAYEQADNVRVPVLLLYGDKDEIIPREPIRDVAARLCAVTPTRIAIYENGYHMLLRDLQAETVWRDIAMWTRDKAAPLPSIAGVKPVARGGADLCSAE